MDKLPHEKRFICGHRACFIASPLANNTSIERLYELTVCPICAAKRRWRLLLVDIPPEKQLKEPVPEGVGSCIRMDQRNLNRRQTMKHSYAQRVKKSSTMGG